MKSRNILNKKCDELSDRICDVKDDDEDSVVQAEMEAALFLNGEVDAIGSDRGREINEEEPEDADDTDFQSGGFVGILSPLIPLPSTDADLDRIIAALKEERKTLPERSELGEPNWKMIDVQIAICEWAKGE